MACRVFAVLNSFWCIDNPPRTFFAFWPVFPVIMWFKFPAGATPFKVGPELGVSCLMTSFQERNKAIVLSCRSVVQFLRVYSETNQHIRPFKKEIFSYSMNSMNYKSSFFLKWRHGLTRPRALLDLITGPTFKGRGSSGKFEPHFHGGNGSEQEKHFGRVVYASETIQNLQAI